MAVLRKVAGVLGTVVSVLLLALIVAFVGLAVAQRRSGEGVPVVAHHVVLTVLSGSMTPVIRTGDVIVDTTVTPAQANDLKVGTIVTYRVKGRTYHGQPMLITHRIVGVLTIRNHATGQVQRLYTTKGDANNAPDPAMVSPAQIVGVYRWRVPDAGYVSAFIHRPIGFGLFIVLPILYLIGGEFLVLWRRLDEQERRERPAGTATPATGDGGAGPAA